MTVLDELERLIKENDWQLEECLDCGQAHIVKKSWRIESDEFGGELSRYHEHVFGCMVEGDNSEQAKFVTGIVDTLPSLLVAARALFTYGEHRDDCHVFKIGTMNAKLEDCTCGYAAVLAPLLKEVGR